MNDRITVSNGQELYGVDPSDLELAERDGFYRPFERGLTIVGNGELLFEIPIGELPKARRGGFEELTPLERQVWERSKQAQLTPAKQIDIKSDSPVASITKPPVETPAVVLNEFDQAEQEAMERQELAEQQLAESKGWKWYAVWLRLWYQQRRVLISRQLRSTGASAIVHVALLMILASLILNTDDEPKGLVLNAAPASDAIVEEVVIEPTPLEITEPTESPDSESPPEAEVVKQETVAAPNFAGAISGDAVKPPARPSASGDGRERPMKRASFFGKRVAAVDYVFVIDNSNSMTGGRFETALNELMIAVNQLTPRQRFYVLFYSDTAYPMFHPTAATGLVPATPRNKELLRRWLPTVQLCLKTEGKEAITAAFALEPDVIFVLGDGAFTDNASRYFAAMPQNKIPLHTLGMEVKPKDAELFAQLAQAHGGTYKDVGVAPGAREIFRNNPRPRNSVRGPIWGLKLKPKPN